MAAFPWRETAALAFNVLKVSPETYWRMTPKEIAMIVEAMGGTSTPFTPADFDRLAANFPDLEHENAR